MQVLEGFSSHTDAALAVAEVVDGWPAAETFSPDIVFAFHSTCQNSDDLSEVLKDRFPDAITLGCSTAGEWRTGFNQKESLVVMAISSEKIRWSCSIVESLTDFSQQSAGEVFASLLNGLGIEHTDLNAHRHFCMALVDGMAGLNGKAVAAMANELGNISFLGGCAGDDLKFEATFVFANGQAYSGGAVFILAECDIPFLQIKHQHFIPGECDVVITGADEAARRVLRLDGKPAAERYAELLGITISDLSPQIFSEQPVMYQYGGEDYVRSIYQVGEGGSLDFFCAVEEGMILNLCKHQNMAEELKLALGQMKQELGDVQLLFMFNCVFRCLEAQGNQQIAELADFTGKSAEHVIGFDTYGELWRGLHINQTLVALAIGYE